MADRYLVQINIAKLRDNLSTAEKKPWTDEQVKEMLRQEHFIERPDGWLCEDMTLDFLDKSEIISKRRFN